ncbi:hypothetical protein [Actinomadura keratinilytica]|uniref:Transcriptional regulator n=1 Tax=Actinomadura keratinilytica TaxID=547461 RepID=A0ABP7Z5R1_9ACTN
MEAFVLGVASSLLATALTVLGSWIGSERSRTWILTFVSRTTGLGVWRVAPRQHLVARQMKLELAEARWVRVLAGRGNELTRDTFASVWRDVGRRIEFVQILLPDSRPSASSWLRRREADMRRIDPGFSRGLLVEQVRVNAAYIREIAHSRHAVDLRFYDLPNLHRLVITDRVAFITIYSPAEHGRNCPTLVARRPGLMYDYALLLFQTAWPDSRPAGDDGES